MPRRNIYFPEDLDELITLYIGWKGVGRSEFLQRGAIAILEGVVDVPVLGTIHAKMSGAEWDKIRQALEALKEQSE